MVGDGIVMSAWWVERQYHRQQDTGARSASQYGNHSCSGASSVLPEGTVTIAGADSGTLCSLPPFMRFAGSVQTSPSISPSKASTGASLTSLLKGICFGG